MGGKRLKKKKENILYPLVCIESNCCALSFFDFPNFSFCKLYRNIQHDYEFLPFSFQSNGFKAIVNNYPLSLKDLS